MDPKRSRTRRAPAMRAPIAPGIATVLAAAMSQSVARQAEPAIPVSTPADARSHGLEGLRTAMRLSGSAATAIGETPWPGRRTNTAAPRRAPANPSSRTAGSSSSAGAAVDAGTVWMRQIVIPKRFSALRNAIFSLSSRGRSTARNQSVPCLMLSMKG